MASIKRGDRRPWATISCLDGKAAADHSTATSVRIIGKIGTTVKVDRSPPGAADGKYVLDWQEDETDLAGKLKLEVEVIWPDGTPQSYPGEGFIELTITPDLG